MRCRDALAAKTTELAELEAAKAQSEDELANAQNSIEELAADKERLESSLASTKASLQACEGKLVSAEVHSWLQPCCLRQCTIALTPFTQHKSLMHREPVERNSANRRSPSSCEATA